VPVVHWRVLHARARMRDFMWIRELLEQGEPIVQRVPSPVSEMCLELERDKLFIVFPRVLRVTGGMRGEVQRGVYRLGGIEMRWRLRVRVRGESDRDRGELLCERVRIALRER
jgi:hypothetical protein